MTFCSLLWFLCVKIKCCYKKVLCLYRIYDLDKLDRRPTAAASVVFSPTTDVCLRVSCVSVQQVLGSNEWLFANIEFRKRSLAFVSLVAVLVISDNEVEGAILDFVLLIIVFHGDISLWLSANCVCIDAIKILFSINLLL